MTEADAIATPADHRAAVSVLAREGLVAYPTETVWGLAACASSPTAVAALRRWKGRADDAPISILVPGAAVLARLDFELSPPARRLLDAFWPGPLTVVLTTSHAFAPGIASAAGTVGVRCSSHPVAAQLAAACDAQGLGPVTSTSLNATGQPPALSRAEARSLCADPETDPSVLASGADASADAPSTVVDCSVQPPRVLRSGSIAASSLEPFLADSLAIDSRETASG